MSITRISIINIVLFLAIIGLSVYIITQERILPGEPPVKQAQKRVDQLITRSEERGELAQAELEVLDEKNIFDSLIPIPTPTPAPTPTPQPPPDIEEVTQYWKLSFVFKSMASFQHIKSQEEFTIKVGERQQETWKGKTVPVYLDSIDRKNWSATIMINEKGVVQKRTFRMFE